LNLLDRRDQARERRVKHSRECSEVDRGPQIKRRTNRAGIPPSSRCQT
jgi:hypothetical protein